MLFDSHLTEFALKNFIQQRILYNRYHFVVIS